MNAAEAYIVAVEGLSALRDLESIPADLQRAALQAINRTLDRTRTASAREMQQQVNFAARYLSGSDGRLQISQKATGDSLEGAITARFRPTSLARFSTGTPGSRNGVRVEVAPGFAKYMRRAFLVRLRAGNDNLDTRSNLGLAIRLRPGETIQNKKKVVRLRDNVYLLYGPSVDQVFQSVAADQAPAAADFLEAEFLRIARLNG